MRTIDRKPWAPNQFVTIQGSVTKLELAERDKNNSNGGQTIRKMREATLHTTIALLKMGAKVPKENRR